MGEDVLNAFAHFRSKKLRTFLSLLGIAIGVTVVTIISNIGSSLHATMINMFDIGSMDTVTIGSRQNFDTQKKALHFTESYRQELKTGIPLIKNIFYSNYMRATVLHKNISHDNQLFIGIEYGWLQAHNHKLAYGTGITLTDFAQHRHVAVLQEYDAQVIFPEGNPIGKKITVIMQYDQNGSRHTIPFTFEICGVVKSDKAGIQFSSETAIYIPRSFLLEEIYGSGVRTAEACEVQLFSATDIDSAIPAIQTFSDEYAKTPDSVWIWSEKAMMDQLNKILLMVGTVLTAIAAVSLLVGGINIMNIMQVTVTERKKEIGIRKALGASQPIIRNQFLVESTALSLFGGTIGVGLGTGISILLVRTVFQKPEFQMIFAHNIPGTAIAFAVSITIGIFFGLHPAIKAAQLDPVVALAG